MRRFITNTLLFIFVVITTLGWTVTLFVQHEYQNGRVFRMHDVTPLLVPDSYYRGDPHEYVARMSSTLASLQEWNVVYDEDFHLTDQVRYWPQAKKAIIGPLAKDFPMEGYLKHELAHIILIDFVHRKGDDHHRVMSDLELLYAGKFLLYK